MIEPKTLFIEKRVSESFKVLPGTGSVTVDIPFVPEYIKVKYLDQHSKPVLDTITYDLVFTGDPLVPYQFTMSWSITSGKSRRLRYTVAKLASFHNGVNK